MARVLVTQAAEEARIEIWLHIAQHNPAAADRRLDRIDDRCRLYARQPLLGEARPDLGNAIRCFSVGKYLVIYRPIPDGIEVLLVIHGARDVPAHVRRLFHARDTS